jgi:hypothetical protein
MNIRMIATKSAGFLLAAAWIGAVTAAPLPPSIPDDSGRLFATAVLGGAAEEITRGSEADLRRQLVSYRTQAGAGTIIIDTAQTHLYYVLGDGTAIRYGIGVGREGFTLDGRTDGHTHGRMARLDAAARHACASALSAALDGRRGRQSPRCPRRVASNL